MPQPVAFTKMFFWLICSPWLRDLVAPSVLDYPPPKKDLVFQIFPNSISVMPRLVAFTRMFFWSICSQWLRDLVAPKVLDYLPPKKGSMFQTFPNQAFL